MKQKRLFLITLISSVMLMAACGNAKETNSTPKEETKEVKAEETTTEPEVEEEKKEESSNGNDGMLNPNIEEESQGNVEVVFTNKDPQFINDLDGFKVSVDEYQIVKVTDVSADYTIPFKDQTEGYVMTAKVTIDNTTDKGIYYNNIYRVQFGSEFDYITNDINKTFVREEFPKSEKETEVGKFAPGEKVSGLISFIFTNDEFKALDSVKPKFIIEGGAADNNQFSGSNKQQAVFDFPYSGGQQEELNNATSFYPDRLTTANMANKEMIFEETAINETKQLDDVKVTLAGVQYTEIEPTPDNKERFRNFGDKGIVAITVKLNLDNQTDSPISLWNISSKVDLDKDRGHIRAQGMVEPEEPKELKAGEQSEKYQVFLMNKDEFELFASFDLQFGPFVGEDGKDMFKGESVEFNLPR